MIKRPLCLVFILTIVIAIGSPRQIQLPTIHDTNSIMLKMGVTKVINQPDVNFQRVYKRQVNKIDNRAIYRYAPCVANRAQVQFQIIDQIEIQGIPKRPDVISSFDQIQYSQFLLDTFYDKNTQTIYVIFKNYKLAIINMQQNLIVSKRVVKVQQYIKDQYLSVGYFVQIQDALLFVNFDDAILISKDSASLLPGYQQITDFQSAIALQNNYFAVIGTLSGVSIYKYEPGGIKKQAQFKCQDLLQGKNCTTIQLRDLVYWRQQKLLITLDSIYGVSTYSLNIDQNIQIKRQNLITESKNCKLMYLYNSNLYVYCKTMKIYNLDAWPKVTQTLLPYPQVQVKQIYQVGDIVAYVGHNGFYINYLGSHVNYYQDLDIDKLILTDQIFISVDQRGLKIGPYKINQPYVSCNTQNPQFMGTSNVIFTTLAQCNDQYFKKFRLNKTELGSITADDICKYTIIKPITVWRVGQFKYYPFLIAFIVLFVVLSKVACIYFAQKFRLNRYKRLIEQFGSENKVSQSAKNEMGQQLEGKNQIIKKSDVAKGSQSQLAGQNPNPNMYDI